MLTPKSSYVAEVAYSFTSKKVYVVYRKGSRKYVYKNVSERDGIDLLRRANLSNLNRSEETPPNYVKGSKKEESVGTIVAIITERYDYEEVYERPAWVR